MKLQFLIPQYKESESVVKSLLDSIAVQQGISFDDIGAIICNDGSDVFLSDGFLSSYPFRIEYHKEPHRGVSATRNACLDYSSAEYVMFCDADDMFFNSLGLWIIFSEMEAPFDCLVSRFVEEANVSEIGFYDFIHHDNDAIFVHGKVFRRQFLYENNLRFDDRLTIHEDSYFIVLSQAVSKRTVYCDKAFYLWKFRKESVCRSDPKYLVKTYPNLLDSDEALLNQFLQRGLQKEAISLVASFTLDSFYSLNKPIWLDPENIEYRHKSERYFSRYFKKYRYLWDQISDSDKLTMSETVRSRNIREGMRFEQISIDEWFAYIEALGNEPDEELTEAQSNKVLKLTPVYFDE